MAHLSHCRSQDRNDRLNPPDSYSVVGHSRLNYVERNFSEKWFYRSARRCPEAIHTLTMRVEFEIRETRVLCTLPGEIKSLTGSC